MLDNLTLETFAPLVGQTFRLQLEGQGDVDAVLHSVNAVPVTGWQPPGGAPVRQPFSLLFLGPPDFVLPQRIYRFEHADLGTLELFIVPVGRTAEVVSYEAVFS